MYMANIFARSLSQSDTSLVANRLGLSENLLPIFIPLRQCSLNSATPAGFLEFLDEYFKRWNIGLPSGFFVPYLEGGICILLLDGLDEVSPSERQSIVQTIISLGRRYPTARIIVTSRLEAYFPGLGEDFAHYVMAELDDAKITDFVKKWSLTLTEDSTQAESRSASILSAIFRSNNLRTLARTPLFLTIIVSLFSYRGELPEQRAILYEDAIDLLLAKWDIARGVSVIKFKPELSLYDTKSLVAALAFSAQDAALDTLEESFILSVFNNEFVKKGLPQSEASNNALSLLRLITERAGILVARGAGMYQFAHRTIQEYLTSIALSENEDYIKLVMERYKDGSWKESISLSIARVARGASKAAEDVIQALLETQTPEGVVVAGLGLLEITPIKNTELQEKIIQSLKALTVDTQIADNLREQAKAILDRLGIAQ
jgi:predicted NACHT family NTPase